MINITCNNKEVRTGTCADVGDSNVVAYISFFDTTNNTERKLYQPVYGDFKTSTAYLFDLSGNSITLTYADSNKTRAELEDLLVDCCGCVGGDGTVTSFSAGNLSPLFTTGVATPTTTPALSFNLSNCNQYQVFGRVASGTGVPSYVSLNPIAFNGLSIPNTQIVFGTGSGVASDSDLTWDYGNNRMTFTANTNSTQTFIKLDNQSTGSSAATEIDMGWSNAVRAYRQSGSDSYLGFFGSASVRFGTVSEGAFLIARKVSTYQLVYTNPYADSRLAIHRASADKALHVGGEVKIDTINTSASNNLLVSDSGVISTRSVASLNIPTITPSALTKTDDTNVTLTLGGTPSTALLQGVSLTMGWNGVLAISRGGTGLSSLGTANQVLRVNAGGTALEYATLTDFDAQTLTWTKATSNLAISNGNSVNLFNLTSLTSGDLIKWDGTDWVNFAPNWTTNTGTVTSVAATMAGNAATVTGSPITASGTLAFSWLGSIYQYVRGDGTLAYLPPSANYLDDLLDVTITSPSTGQLLRYNGSQWVNWTPNFLTSNQTITLSGDVTGSGATSIVTTIAANAVTTSKIANTAVTFAKIQNINTNRLLGRSSAGSGSVEEISIGSGLSLSGGTLSASGGAGNNVWLVQSSGIQATTNLEDIYHVGKVKVGSSGTSSFMLSVSGTTYSSQGMYINNNYPYYGYNTSAVPIIIGKIDSSNRVSLGENNYNIILPAYTSSRSADSLATTDGYLYVTNAGVLNKHEVDLARNEGASVLITSTESHAADSTYRRVTFDIVNLSLYGGYTADYTTGDNKIILPSSVRYHFVIATIEYTTSGTPTVTVDIRKNSTAIETNISTSDDERKVMTVHTLMYNASSSQYPTIYIKVSGSAITLQKCKLTAIPCGMAGS